jgi:heme/copper-type cytochrome/quinol oxidase subunit 2
MTEEEQVTHEETVTTEETKSSSSMMIVGILIALVVFGGVAFALRHKISQKMKSMSGDTQTAQTESKDKMASGSPMAMASSSPDNTAGTGIKKEGDVNVVTMNAGAFYYAPKEIVVKEGEKVKIIMTSKDMMHDFNIDELKVKLPITKSGETSTVEFTATKKGTFEYYCSVGQHRSRGQVGTLIVK